MISYKKLYKIFVFILFISFIVLYFAQKGGYYERINNEKKELTNEQIQIFEEDVRNGKKIDINNYIINNEKKYDNKISRFGLLTSNLIGKYFKKGIIKGLSHYFSAIALFSIFLLLNY